METVTLKASKDGVGLGLYKDAIKVFQPKGAFRFFRLPFGQSLLCFGSCCRAIRALLIFIHGNITRSTIHSVHVCRPVQRSRV